MRVGDLALYWPKWHPTIQSEPEGIATLIQYDDEEWKLAERKPPNPKWQVLFNGKLLWASTWQVMELKTDGYWYENR